MKRIFLLLIITAMFYGHALCQQRISKKELEALADNAKGHPLLQDNDADFKVGSATEKWSNESAVILCQKTSFDFDKQGPSAGKIINRNFWGIVLAIPTMGTSLLFANMHNETKILIEETERRKIELKDKFALEQYSVLYFRLSASGDAFAARVIKKDGSTQNIELADAIKIEDIRMVPDIFKSYTDQKLSSTYRPSYFKIAVPDLEEGDIVEYEYINFNTQRYMNNPDYKEFDPVYYLCNRSMPVAKQVIEVTTEDDKYYIAYKSLKGAPDFMQTTSGGKKVYRWEDDNREKITDTRYVNELKELPSIKFQVIYAKNSNRDFIWFKDEADMKKDISADELADKAKTFWFNPQNLRTTGDYTAGLRTDIDATVKTMYKSMKKKGIADDPEDEYVRKVYYTIRSQTLYGNWSDYAFAKVFAGLLAERKLPYEVIVTASNQRTDIEKVSFTQELSWIIKYKGNYFTNPNENENPNEVPEYIAGNNAIHFDGNSEKSQVSSEPLPQGDTASNILLTQITATLDTTAKINVFIDKTTEAKGCVKDAVIDDILAFTPFMENDFKYYDGSGMWEGLDSRQEEKAIADFNEKKKEWKEEKPKMMKALAENDYGFDVTKYNAFRLLQDGRNYKKPGLKYNETFTLAEMTSFAGEDIVIKLPALISGQTKIKKEERVRSLPIDVGYPRTLKWQIGMHIPNGYTVIGLNALNKNISNDCGSFISTARINADNTLMIDVTKMYKLKRMDAQQWPQMLDMLDAAYNFSQAKIILKKK